MLLQGLTHKLQVGDLDSCLDIMIEVRFGKGEFHCLSGQRTENQFTNLEIIIAYRNENNVLSHLLDQQRFKS